MNAQSSRSHAIFSVIVDQTRQVKTDDSGTGRSRVRVQCCSCIDFVVVLPRMIGVRAEVSEDVLSSKFNFVDLAGI